MTAGLAAMLAGIFGVPALLLLVGHRLRRRSMRVQSAFWGAVAGHLLAMVIGSVAAMNPPEEWAPTDTWRGMLGLWSFLLFPLAGVLLATIARWGTAPDKTRNATR